MTRISRIPILGRAAGALVLGVAAVGGILHETADLMVTKAADKASPTLMLAGWPLS
jgi:hypothetical protein